MEVPIIYSIIAYFIASFGAKGLVVATGGTAELWGKLYGPSWTHLSQPVYPGSTTLTVEDTLSWTVGSKVVLASTDFSELVAYNQIAVTSTLAWMRGAPSPNQNEVLTVVSIAGNTVTVAEPIKYLHWGSGYERAELGLLSRHIVVQGDNSSIASQFGGHFMMRNAQVHVSGVEFTRMGQKGVMGRYPVHFHMMDSVIGKGYFANHNSIHDNFQRCLVIHGKSPRLLKPNNFSRI